MRLAKLIPPSIFPCVKSNMVEREGLTKLREKVLGVGGNVTEHRRWRKPDARLSFNNSMELGGRI